MHKKGILDIVKIAVNLMIVIVVAIFILIVTLRYLNEDIDTIGLETFFLTRNLMYSDSCLAYNDGTRTHLGIIDIQKINFDTLNRCFSKEGFGYVILVDDIDGNTLTSASNLDVSQESYLPICSNLEKYKCLTRKELVSYFQNGEIKTGHMITQVIKLV